MHPIVMMLGMGRLRRTSEQIGWFHLTTRGVDRQDIFSDTVDRDRFVEEMVSAADRFGVEIHAFSLMSNHVHLLVHCPDGGVSDFAQRLFKRYAEFHNPRVGRIGHLFAARFSSTVVDLEHETNPTAIFQQMARYVHRNPLDRRTLSELGSDPYSSYGMYLGRRPTPDWMVTERLLGSHGDDRERLRSFTENPHPSDKTPRNGCEFVPYAISDVAAAVSVVAGVPLVGLLLPTARVANPARDLAAHMAQRLRTGTARELAEAFGVSSESAFRRLASRGKDRVGLDAHWECIERRTIERLWCDHLDRRHRDSAVGPLGSAGAGTERTQLLGSAGAGTKRTQSTYESHGSMASGSMS